MTGLFYWTLHGGMHTDTPADFARSHSCSHTHKHWGRQVVLRENISLHLNCVCEKCEESIAVYGMAAMSMPLWLTNEQRGLMLKERGRRSVFSSLSPAPCSPPPASAPHISPSSTQSTASCLFISLPSLPRSLLPCLLSSSPCASFLPLSSCWHHSLPVW